MGRLCDEKCRACTHFDFELAGCTYILETERTRGTITMDRNGWRSIKYPDACGKFKLREGCAETMGYLDTGTGRTVRRVRALGSYPERDRLYAQGLSDREIAAELGVAATTITNWRRARGLVRNKTAADTELVKRNARRRELYEQGLSDMEIAEREGVCCQVISSWRKRNHLSVHPAVRERSWALRARLYDSGATDEEIARTMGCSALSVKRWRQRNGLRSNSPYGEDEELLPVRGLGDFPERDALYAAGATDKQIAEAEGVTRNTIAKWRNRRRLPPN